MNMYNARQYGATWVNVKLEGEVTVALPGAKEKANVVGWYEGDYGAVPVVVLSDMGELWHGIDYITVMQNNEQFLAIAVDIPERVFGNDRQGSSARTLADAYLQGVLRPSRNGDAWYGNVVYDTAHSVGMRSFYFNVVVPDDACNMAGIIFYSACPPVINAFDEEFLLQYKEMRATGKYEDFYKRGVEVNDALIVKHRKPATIIIQHGELNDLVNCMYLGNDESDYSGQCKLFACVNGLVVVIIKSTYSENTPPVGVLIPFESMCDYPLYGITDDEDFREVCKRSCVLSKDIPHAELESEIVALTNNNQIIEYRG